MTSSNTSIVAKASTAFVAVAMMLSMVAPAKAATVAELQAMIAQLTAQLSSLSGSTTTTTVAATTFTRSLTVGSQGADVTALQNYLISAGHPLAAGATGYFGAQTAAAVKAWQVKNGVTPATGYFGPVSQAKYSAMVATTGSTTGSTSSTGLTGGAGSATVTSYSSDVEDEVTTGTDEKVVGFKVEADDSDVKVTNLKLTLTYTGAKSNIATRYFDSFDVTVDGNVVATVDASDFNRDSSGVYSKNVALKDAIVREGSSKKATFYVVAHANDAIDTDDAATTWTVTASDLRYTDASGAILTIGTVNNNTGVNVTKLSASGDVKVKYSLSTDSPVAATVKVDDDNSGDKVELLKFRVKAEGTDVSFDQVKFTISTSSAMLSTMASEFILMKGSSVVETEDSFVATTSDDAIVTFDLDDEEMIDEDATATYTLVAKMNKNTFSGASITATLLSTNVMDANGDSVASSRISGSASGDAQTFRGDGVTLAKTSITASDVQKTENNSTAEYAKFVVVFKVTADGDDVYVASTTAAITKTLTAGTAAGSSLTSTADQTAQGNYRINDGETETFTYTLETATSSAATIKLIVDSFAFGTVEGTYTSSQAFTPVSTWTSDAVILN